MCAAYGLEEFVLLKLHTKSIFSSSNVNTMSKRKGISESDKAPKKKLKSDSIDADIISIIADICDIISIIADICYGKNFIAERLSPTQGEAVLTKE